MTDKKASRTRSPRKSKTPLPIDGDGPPVPAACVPPPGYALVPTGGPGLYFNDGFNVGLLPKPDITDPPPELKWGQDGPFWATPAGAAKPAETPPEPTNGEPM